MKIEASADRTDRTEVQGAARRPLRVLVADDIPQARDGLRLLFASTAHEIIYVENGEEAVSVACDGEAFDVILMDVQMPVLDGLSATRRIRSFEEENGRPRASIIALSALTGIRDRCLGSGCDEFMNKPFTRRGIFHLISQLTYEKWMAPMV